MSESLVLLASSTTSDEFGYKNKEARPPKVTFKNSFGVKVSKVIKRGESWMEWRREEHAAGGTYMRPLKYRWSLLKVQSFDGIGGIHWPGS